ncbi:hypothetical protein [Phytopseudomonas flavescens]|uniref:hypothetical protein n=1 Tax=Phytopseudomonas flavescens TaxID=29435 RepID=UPI0011137B5C|nr:hypothetical protein [Pseudomonas flavescens]
MKAIHCRWRVRCEPASSTIRADCRTDTPGACSHAAWAVIDPGRAAAVGRAGVSSPGAEFAQALCLPGKRLAHTHMMEW